MSTEVNKMSNNKPEKKDKITIEIDHKWGKFLGAALTVLSSFGVLEYNGVVNLIDDAPAPIECQHVDTTVGDVNLNFKGVK
ncbi:hypothetical protein [uncultured Gammaproteobacteria bacterium]|jgi:hypothetical protein|nr:hypothetical protein [uncultured Gammaproteobacteria bacterium]